jgi:hypothetical protein
MAWFELKLIHQPGEEWTTGATAREKKMIDKWIKMQGVYNQQFTSAIERCHGDLVLPRLFGRKINSRPGCFCPAAEMPRKGL